jgi:hypothetical protein
MARAKAPAPAQKNASMPTTTPEEALAALDALAAFDTFTAPPYRQASKQTVVALLEHGPALAPKLLDRVRKAPFPVASVAATALLRITRKDREVLRIADLLAAFDRPGRDAVWNQKWTLPVKQLGKLLGKRATEVFDAAVLRDDGHPPLRRLGYARQVLDKKAIISLVERAVEAGGDPSWLVHPMFDDLAVTPKTRERALVAYFSQPVPTSVGNQRIRTFGREVRHALALDRCPTRIHDRLRTQATALAKMMERTYYAAFDEIMTSADMRAARKKLARDVAPLVEPYDRAKALCDEARRLRDETPAKLTDTTLNRFRTEIGDGALRWHLASAAIAASQRRKRDVARALAELVLAADRKNTRAAWALAIVERRSLKN